MSQPGARVGDSTLHGPPILGTGCPTVLIGNRPAWRMGGDIHTCPLVNAPPPAGPGTPHLTGFATMGSATVIIGQMPAVRMGDQITEPGAVIPLPPPNPILSGEFTVLIGGPTAVMTFNKALGAWTCNFGPNITMQGTPDFVAFALRDLGTLNAIPSGQRLLASINSSGNRVTIIQSPPGGDSASDGPNWSNPNLTNGTGMDATIQYNPNQTPMYGNGQPWDNPPTSVTLGHEMTHASHITNGNLPGDPTTGPGVPNDTSGLPMNRALEERRTVGAPASPNFGIPDYSHEPFSENTFRQDLGEPLRPTYLDPTATSPTW